MAGRRKRSKIGGMIDSNGWPGCLGRGYRWALWLLALLVLATPAQAQDENQLMFVTDLLPDATKNVNYLAGTETMTNSRGTGIIDRR